MAGGNRHLKKVLEIALGVVTSVGGFLEIGSIATATQAGAAFGYQLAWSILLGTLCIAFLVEMSGRFSAVSKHTIPDAMRERFGANFFAVPLLVLLGVSLLVLAAEIGGTAAALEMATGIAFPVWAIPAALLSWAILWRGNFGVIEKPIRRASHPSNPPPTRTTLMPSKMWKRGSYFPGPQLRYGVLSVIVGDNATIAPTLSERFGHPSRRLPMPGANESSTVE